MNRIGVATLGCLLVAAVTSGQQPSTATEVAVLVVHLHASTMVTAVPQP